MKTMEFLSRRIDPVVAGLEQSAQFIIEYRTIKEVGVNGSGEVLQLERVNGAGSSAEYNLQMIGLFKNSVAQAMEVFRSLGGDDGLDFLGHLLARAVQLVDCLRTRVAVHYDDSKEPPANCTCRFVHMTCMVDGVISEDPLLLLRARSETGRYARIWYKMIEGIGALLRCCYCLAGRPMDVAFPCSEMLRVSHRDRKPGLSMPTCPSRFVDSIVSACEEQEIMMAEEHHESAAARIAGLRAMFIRTGMLSDVDLLN